MDLQYQDKHGNNVQIGDECRFFWNPILNQDSELFDYALPIVYIPDFASFGFCIVSKKGETCNVSLFVLTNFSEFGFEKIAPTLFDNLNESKPAPEGPDS